MSEDREGRIRDDWYYTYRSWDAADDARRLQREQEITRLQIEDAHLEQKIERAERSDELDKLRHNIDAQIQTMRRAKESISRNISECRNPEIVWLEYFTGNALPTEQDLKKIDVTSPEASAELAVLLKKVTAFLVVLREEVRSNFAKTLLTKNLRFSDEDSRPQLFLSSHRPTMDYVRLKLENELHNKLHHVLLRCTA